MGDKILVLILLQNRKFKLVKLTADPFTITKVFYSSTEKIKKTNHNEAIKTQDIKIFNS